jgi:hypothetical protein
MTEAVVITTPALNVLFAVAGGLIGMTAAAVVVRGQTVNRRAFMIERDLRQSLGVLERHRMDPASFEEAIKSQQMAVQRIRDYSQRRMYFYRLLFGYLALLGLAATAIWTLLKTQDAVPPQGVLRWFVIGLAGAVALNLIAYVTAAMRRLMLAPPLNFGRLSIPLESALEIPHELELEASVNKWLGSQGFQVSPAAPRSGFDLLARKDDLAVAVDVKAVPRLTIEDVDAVRGAALRLKGIAEEEIRPLVAVPDEALPTTSSASPAIEAAEVLGIEVISVDKDGNVAVATKDGWAGHAAVAG